MTSSSNIAAVTVAPATLIFGPDDYASPQAVTVDLGDVPSATRRRRRVALRELNGTPSMPVFDSDATGVWIGACSPKWIGGWEHCRIELTETQDNRLTSSLPVQRGKGRGANPPSRDALLYSAAHGTTDGGARRDSGAAHPLPPAALPGQEPASWTGLLVHLHKRADRTDQAGSRFADQALL